MRAGRAVGCQRLQQDRLGAGVVAVGIADRGLLDGAVVGRQLDLKALDPPCGTPGTVSA